MLVSIPVKTYVLALVLYTAESYRSVLNVLLNIGDVARRLQHNFFDIDFA